MTCTRQDLEIIRGVNKTLRLTITDEEGATVDLTGGTVYFRVKVALTDASPVISKSSANPAQIEILNQVTYKGKADIKLVPTDTASLNPVSHVYDCWFVDAGLKRYAVVPPAKFTIEQAVTVIT